MSTRTEKQQGYDVVFVTCAFEQATLDVKVVFNEAQQIAGLFFVPVQSPSKFQKYTPPAYVKPDAFQEKEVSVGAGEWILPGTLSLPVGDGPFPAVVLVHGSGPQDRDETIGPNKPFRDLAWGLASQGIAVLRYEKRTKEHATKCTAQQGNFTVYEVTIEDALAAVSLLRETEGIGAERIFVLGHSMGGMLAPRIGILASDIAGFIIMAGTSKPLEDVILEQYSYIFALDGTLSDGEKKQLEKIEQQIAKVKDPQLSIATPASNLPLGLPARYWLDLRGYSPPEVAKDLKQPLFILQGERDYQVTTEDFEGWKIALSSRENVEFRLYPTLNHLFIEGEGPSTPAEYETPGHVLELVIDDMANWIEQH